MRARCGIGAALFLVLFGTALACLTSCATVPPAPGSPPAPPAASAPVSQVPVPARVEPRHEVASSAASVDSALSPDAERVLGSIPEPLTPGQQVPPPVRARPRQGVTVMAPEAAFDTLRVERAPAEEGAGVPVPSPTPPSNNVPPVRFAAPESTISSPARTAPALRVPAAIPPLTSAPLVRSSAPGDCWRLQVAAPVEQVMADSRREAAQSLLVVPMVIELERGLYKVRTHDCMSRAAADALKLRAADSGFEGAFVVNTAAALSVPKPKPAPAAHHATVKHRKRRR